MNDHPEFILRSEAPIALPPAWTQTLKNPDLSYLSRFDLSPQGAYITEELWAPSKGILLGLSSYRH